MPYIIQTFYLNVLCLVLNVALDLAMAYPVHLLLDYDLHLHFQGYQEQQRVKVVLSVNLVFVAHLYFWGLDLAPGEEEVVV